MWLVFYSYVENACTTASFHYGEGRGECWTHKTILTPPHFIEVSVPNQESRPSWICVLGLSDFLPFLQFFYWILEDEFEDTKGVIRFRRSKKNRQHNDQNKNDKRTNKDLQNIRELLFQWTSNIKNTTKSVG